MGTCLHGGQCEIQLWPLLKLQQREVKLVSRDFCWLFHLATAQANQGAPKHHGGPDGGRASWSLTFSRLCVCVFVVLANAESTDGRDSCNPTFVAPELRVTAIQRLSRGEKEESAGAKANKSFFKYVLS